MDNTLCSLISLFIPGFPTFPLTFLPNTSCFKRVNFVSKALNCSSIRFSFSFLSGSLSLNCFRFFFPTEGLVIADNDCLNALSCDPFFPILGWWEMSTRWMGFCPSAICEFSCRKLSPEYLVALTEIYHVWQPVAPRNGSSRVDHFHACLVLQDHAKRDHGRRTDRWQRRRGFGQRNQSNTFGRHQSTRRVAQSLDDTHIQGWVCFRRGLLIVQAPISFDAVWSYDNSEECIFCMLQPD